MNALAVVILMLVFNVFANKSPAETVGEGYTPATAGTDVTSVTVFATVLNVLLNSLNVFDNATCDIVAIVILSL
jgi:hypothetical protein